MGWWVGGLVGWWVGGLVGWLVGEQGEEKDVLKSSGLLLVGLDVVFLRWVLLRRLWMSKNSCFKQLLRS